MKTAEEYRINQLAGLKKEKEIRERQKMSLAFSFLQREERAELKVHTLKNGTSLESLSAFRAQLLAFE